MKLVIFLVLAFLVVLVGCKEIITVEVPVEDDNTNEDNMYMVSHSEYWSGEEGQIITRLLNYQGQAIVATCEVNILYPNKTYFAVNQSMTFSVDSYYYSFTTPDTEGVYEYKATCTYAGGSKTRSVMNSFHLSPALNFIQISYDNLSQQIADLSNLSSVNFQNTTFNLEQIQEDTDYIRENLLTNASILEYQTDVLSKLDNISAFCNTSYMSSSALCLWVSETKERLIGMNASVDSYLYVINGTTDTTQTAIEELNLTVSGIGQFGASDREMLEKVYNCTILGQGCFLNTSTIWEYNGRYIHGEIT